MRECGRWVDSARAICVVRVSPIVRATSAEALAAELNRWMRTTNALHRCTLELSMRYFQFGKLAAHVNALASRTTAQVRGREVLGFVSQTVDFDTDWVCA